MSEKWWVKSENYLSLIIILKRGKDTNPLRRPIGMKNIDFAAVLFFVALGVCPLLFGLYFFWASGQQNLVSCTRLETQHIDCQIDRAFLGVIPGETVRVNNVKGTEVSTTCEDGSCTYAIHLLTAETAVPLTVLPTSNQSGIEEEQARFDQFLTDIQATSLAYQSSPSWLALVISALFSVAGGFMVLRGIKAAVTNAQSD